MQQLLNVDIKLLKRQKQAILRAIQDAHDANNKKDEKLLNGVLNLLDMIHDEIDPPLSTIIKPIR